MPIDPETGLWVRDDKANPGDVGAQQDAPVDPPRMSFVQQDPTVITANEPPAPQPGGVPTPDVLPQAPPGLPQVQPYQPQAVPPIPTSKTVSPAEAQNLGAIDQNTIDRMQTAQQGGQAKTAAAESQAAAASRDQYATEGQQADHERIAQEFAQRLQEREQQANADYAKYKSFGIKDPQAEDSFATRILKAIAIGMGAYASGMNGGQNQALSIIQQANKDNIDRQKAQQEKLFQLAERSGKDVEAAKKERDEAFRQLDLKHAALLDSSAQQLKTELARIGVPEAQIAANKDLQTIQKDALDLREKNLADIRGDETSLAKADMAAAARKHAKGGGGGGGSAAIQAMADAANAGKPVADVTLAGVKAGMNSKEARAQAQAYVADYEKRGGIGKSGPGGAGTAVARDEQGNPIGVAPSARALHQFETRDADYARAADQLQRLKEDIDKNGARVLSPEAIKRRQTLYENAKIAVATVSPLGKTDEAMKTEAASLGSSGAPTSVMGMMAGANPSAVAQKLMELKNQRQRYRNEELTPITGAEAAKAQKGMGVGIPGDGGGKKEDPRVGLARKAISDPNAPPAVKARALQILRSLNQADAL